MIEAAAGFLTALEQGDYQSCLFLADWLEEQGRAGQARRLRTRYRRWANRVDYARLHAQAVEQQARQPLLEVVRAVGGKASCVIKVEPDTSHEDGLLVAYVRRLLEEEEHG